MGVSTASQHSHRSTTKSSHRPFKSRHATKSAIRDATKGKVEKSFGPNAKSRHQQVASKIDRKHQARQQRLSKHKEHVQNTSIFQGHKGAPRIVAVVPLAGDVSAAAAIEKLNTSLEVLSSPVNGRPVAVEVDRFRQKVQYVPSTRDLFSALDACRLADFVIFVLSATEEVDDRGELLLKSVETQGISNVVTVVHGLDSIEPIKRKSQVSASLKSFIQHFFPTQERIHSLDSAQECVNAVRSICTATPKGIRWREERSWLLADETNWIASSDDGTTTGTLVVRGTVRGKNLNANRLVQIGDLGAYQIDKIIEAPALRGKKRKADDLNPEDPPKILQEPDPDQDDLAELAPEEIIMRDDDGMASEVPTERKGVLLDDHHYFSDEEAQAISQPRRLPKGTSNYQAAWYLDDMSDSGSDMESVVADEDFTGIEDDKARPEDGLEGLDTATMRDPTEGAPSEYPQSEMFVDRAVEDEAEELAAFRKSHNQDAEDDLEFPDEIELQPNVLAKDRLTRYRGLKSLRTSAWETSEDQPYEPEGWNRLLRVADYRGSKSRATRESLVGGIGAGTRVDIHIRNVPTAEKDALLSTNVLGVFALLRHEGKHVVANYSITLNSDHPGPVKSKAPLIAQCGPRRFLINPLFSAGGNTPNNVHKFDRYLHPGTSCMATFMGPLSWGSIPILYFQPSQAGEGFSEPTASLKLIGTGTSQAPDQNRVVAKRVILTGHPFKIHKKLVTIRYMFFNTEDVRWFKALQLWTRRGRSGYIKETLGTHGYFKATFDAKINPQDSIGISLYKRVFPRPCQPWRPGSEQAPELVASEPGAEEKMEE